jgi:hypothetical protein
MDMLVRVDVDSAEGFPFSQLRIVLALPWCVLQFHSLRGAPQQSERCLDVDKGESVIENCLSARLHLQIAWKK